MWIDWSTHRETCRLGLRLIGRFLDDHGAGCCRIIQFPEGYTVLYQVGAAGPSYTALTFRNEELRADQEKVEQQRAQGQKRARRQDPESWRTVMPQRPGGYEDFLRALGQELDDAEAFSIVIDEVDDRFLVTYIAQDQADNWVPKKYMHVIDAEMRRKIMEGAYPRRKQPEDKRSALGRILG